MTVPNIVVVHGPIALPVLKWELTLRYSCRRCRPELSYIADGSVDIKSRQVGYS